MASKTPEIVSHRCAYFSTILKASKEYTADLWRLYDFQYRQQAAATNNKDWSVVDTSLFSRCLTGHAKKVSSCSNYGSLKHDTPDCPRRKGKRPANEENSSQLAKKPKTNLCYNYIYKRPCYQKPHANGNMAAFAVKQTIIPCWIAPNITRRNQKGSPNTDLTATDMLTSCSHLYHGHNPNTDFK